MGPGRTLPAGFQISNNTQADSVDLTFAPANGQFVRAIGMAPLYFDSSATTATSHSGSLEIVRTSVLVPVELMGFEIE